MVILANVDLESIGDSIHAKRQNKQNDRARVYISATRSNVSPIPSPLSSIQEINAGDTLRQFTVIHRVITEAKSGTRFFTNVSDSKLHHRSKQSKSAIRITGHSATNTDRAHIQRLRDLIQTHNLCHKASLSSRSSSNQSQIIRPDKRSIGDRTTRGRAGEKDAKGVTFSRKQSRRSLLKKQGFPETTAQRKRIETVARAPTKASPHLREEREKSRRQFYLPYEDARVTALPEPSYGDAADLLRRLRQNGSLLAHYILEDFERLPISLPKSAPDLKNMYIKPRSEKPKYQKTFK
ncbi:hypothetical protein YC2023_060906 [Brassica napus]